jgi:hypothetical protein
MRWAESDSRRIEEFRAGAFVRLLETAFLRDMFQRG